jgi:hypothetical protein
MSADDRPPLARSGHCGCPLPAGHEYAALIFGGYTETTEKERTATNEAWVFSRTKELWSPVTYKSDAVPEVISTSVYSASAVIRRPICYTKSAVFSRNNIEGLSWKGIIISCELH